MSLTKLKTKRDKLDEQIRKAEQREREQKQRNFLKLARKHGLLNLEQSELESKLAKIADVTESETTSDTVAPVMVRTPAPEPQPETASEPPKRKWGLP
jgi:hypothetical protein